MNTTPKERKKCKEATSTITKPPPDLPDPCVACHGLKHEKIQEKGGVKAIKKREGATKNSP